MTIAVKARCTSVDHDGRHGQRFDAESRAAPRPLRALVAAESRSAFSLRSTSVMSPACGIEQRGGAANLERAVAEHFAVDQSSQCRQGRRHHSESFPS